MCASKCPHIPEGVREKETRLYLDKTILWFPVDVSLLISSIILFSGREIERERERERKREWEREKILT